MVSCLIYKIFNSVFTIDILTQHVGPKMMSKGVGGGGGGAMIFENILMKTNLKMGGSNFNIVTPDVFKRAIRNNQDVL